MYSLTYKSRSIRPVWISLGVRSVQMTSWRIGEPGDGWALGAALRRAFPSAFVVVLAAETSVPTLQQAINRGFDQLYEESYPAEKVAADILARPSRQSIN